MAAMFDFYQNKQDRIRHVLQKTPHKPFLQSSVPIESEIFEEIIKLWNVSNNKGQNLTNFVNDNQMNML